MINYLVFSLAFVCVTPPFEAPDEPSHLVYVNFVARELALPNQLDPTRSVYAQGHQGPLYYLIAGMAVRAALANHTVMVQRATNREHIWGGGTRQDVPVFTGPTVFGRDSDYYVFYGLRILSVLFGLLTLYYTNRVAALLLDDFGARLMALLLAATLPQFLYMSAVISADGLVALLCAASAYEFLRALRHDAARPFVRAGVFLGLALLAKKTALFLVPAMLIVVLGHVLAGRSRPLRLVRNTFVTFGIATVVAGWWFARNQLLYGDVLGTSMERATLDTLVTEKSLTSLYFWWTFPRMLGASFVGLFAWMSAWLPRSVYGIYALIAGVAAVGIVIRLRGARGRDASIWIAIAFVASCLAGIVFFNLTYNQPQGRYLFCALPFVVVLAAGGLAEALSPLQTSRTRLLAIAALAALLLVIDVVSIRTMVDFAARAAAA